MTERGETQRSVYTLDNNWAKARARLQLIEQIFDPATTARIAALGLSEGWRCLELGAGAGSVARWLCDRVGPTGQVTAVDLETKFLTDDPRPNLEILAQDIVGEGIPGDGWDLIHARCLLMHLPDTQALLTAIVDRLRPGGAILIEDADFYPVATSEWPDYAAVCLAMAEAMGARGAGVAWGRGLPAAMARAGVEHVGSVGVIEMFNGRSPMAVFLDMSIEQLTPLMTHRGMSADRIGRARADLQDPEKWFPAYALVSAWGMRAA